MGGLQVWMCVVDRTGVDPSTSRSSKYGVQYLTYMTFPNDDDDDDDEDDDSSSQSGGVQPILAASSTTRPGSLESSNANTVPPIYIAKYNRFVDNILERINRILRKSYDPVNVRLHPTDKKNKKKNNTKNGGASSGSGGKKKKNTNRRRRPSGSKGKRTQRPREGEQAIATPRSTTSTTEPAPEVLTNNTLADAVLAVSEQLTAHSPAQSEHVVMVQVPTIQKVITPEHRASRRARRPTGQKGNKTNKGNNSRARPGARATLYGLSSIKRDGDVTVNIMSSHTTVKTKFTVGPLMLKVEKEFGRGAKKDIRSATATTTEMFGKLNLRVFNGGAATLHSIRVSQPKQVRVESMDDHDKTREYVWRRSSHIAHVVSQKLTNATRSMLQPPPMATSLVL